MSLEAVGAPEIMVARVEVAAAIEESHSKQAPPTIKAMSLYLRDYPNASQVSSTLGPVDITSSTLKQDTRARARSVALKVENTAVDQTWKLGTFRLDIQESGRR